MDKAYRVGLIEQGQSKQTVATVKGDPNQYDLYCNVPIIEGLKIENATTWNFYVGNGFGPYALIAKSAPFTGDVVIVDKGTVTLPRKDSKSFYKKLVKIKKGSGASTLLCCAGRRAKVTMERLPFPQDEYVSIGVTAKRTGKSMSVKFANLRVSFYRPNSAAQIKFL